MFTENSIKLNSIKLFLYFFMSICTIFCYRLMNLESVACYLWILIQIILI